MLTEKSLLWLIVIMLAQYVGHNFALAWTLVGFAAIDGIIVGYKKIKNS